MFSEEWIEFVDEQWNIRDDNKSVKIVDTSFGTPFVMGINDKALSALTGSRATDTLEYSTMKADTKGTKDATEVRSTRLVKD